VWSRPSPTHCWFPSNCSLQFCPECKQQVTATTLFTRSEAKEALSTGAECILHYHALA
jgi:hypothetical protein